MARVFLSYDHDDFALAKPVATALEKAGHTVWYDRHIHGGAQFTQKIEQALDDADAVLVLWSANSLDSAWVRDEAAEGRDRNKLVPLSLGSVTPPMGFRQYQTIDLGSWKGRGRVPRLDEILDAIGSQMSADRLDEERSQPPARHAPPSLRERPRGLLPLLAVAVLLLAGFAAWKWIGNSGLPVVEVTAADPSPASKAAANDLFVKLGGLAQVGQGKWKLVDTASAPSNPDFVFRTTGSAAADRATASLVLLDGKDDSLLWSREFTFPAGGEADLKQQVSFTAGRVLGCALETIAAGGLRRDLFKIFLTVCAEIAETSFENPEQTVRPLRAIVEAAPKFTPAWGRLIYAQMNVIDVSNNGGTGALREMRTLQADMRRAAQVAPELPELKLAEAKLVPPTDYAKKIALVEQAASVAPDKPEILADAIFGMTATGRMNDAVGAARQVTALDPLSPAATTQLIMMLSYSGQIETARDELARAERTWKGTEALRDAEWSFHLRYGDPIAAKRFARFSDTGLDLYLNARAVPSPANVERLLAHIRPFANRTDSGGFGFAIQAMAEFGSNDELFRWISNTPTNFVAMGSYLFFRPAFKKFRSDPRFFAVAKRIGLLDYWRASGKWPDFCSDPQLPYDCKAEAAKYAR